MICLLLYSTVNATLAVLFSLYINCKQIPHFRCFQFSFVKAIMYLEVKTAEIYPKSLQRRDAYSSSKAELLQLNRTQFPSLEIFISKNVGNRKNEVHFYYISFKSCILGDLSFFDFQLFLLRKNLREGN